MRQLSTARAGAAHWLVWLDSHSVHQLSTARVGAARRWLSRPLLLRCSRCSNLRAQGGDQEVRRSASTCIVLVIPGLTSRRPPDTPYFSEYLTSSFRDTFPCILPSATFPAISVVSVCTCPGTRWTWWVSTTSTGCLDKYRRSHRRNGGKGGPR